MAHLALERLLLEDALELARRAREHLLAYLAAGVRIHRRLMSNITRILLSVQVLFLKSSRNILDGLRTCKRHSV